MSRLELCGTKPISNIIFNNTFSLLVLILSIVYLNARETITVYNRILKYVFDIFILKALLLTL